MTLDIKSDVLIINKLIENTVSGPFVEFRGTIILIWAREMWIIRLNINGFAAWRSYVYPTKPSECPTREILFISNVQWLQFYYRWFHRTFYSLFSVSCTDDCNDWWVLYRLRSRDRCAQYDVWQSSELRRHDTAERVRRLLIAITLVSLIALSFVVICHTRE